MVRYTSTDNENDDTEVRQIIEVLPTAECIKINEYFDLEDDESEIESSVTKLLLQHKLCATHMLNLVTEDDSFKARENVKYKRIYDKAMAKVQALPNAVHLSTKNVDIVEYMTLLK